MCALAHLHFHRIIKLKVFYLTIQIKLLMKGNKELFMMKNMSSIHNGETILKHGTLYKHVFCLGTHVGYAALLPVQWTLIKWPHYYT